MLYFHNFVDVLRLTYLFLENDLVMLILQHLSKSHYLCKRQ